MENISLTIEKKKRSNLKTGSRIFQCLYGFILILIGARIMNDEPLHLYGIAIILMGLISLAYGIIGKELLPTHNYLILDSNHLKIKNSSLRAQIIEMSAITYMKLTPDGFDVTFNDFAKSYDLSWLSAGQFQLLKSKLHQFGNQNNITIE